MSSVRCHNKMFFSFKIGIFITLKVKPPGATSGILQNYAPPQRLNPIKL